MSLTVMTDIRPARHVQCLLCYLLPSLALAEGRYHRMGRCHAPLSWPGAVDLLMQENRAL
jgi:hypothetical protein